MGTSFDLDKCNSSMQLTRAADYAVRVMIYLAGLPAGERVSLSAVVHATSAPDSFLSKVLQGLTRAHLITSRRGPAGGFEISSLGRLASMRDVIEAIDGPISLNVCVSQRRSCPRQSWCPAHLVWARAQGALMGVLSSAIIGDLASESGDTFPREHIMTGPVTDPAS